MQLEMNDFLNKKILGQSLDQLKMKDFLTAFFNSPQSQQSAALALFSAHNTNSEELIGALNYVLSYSKTLSTEKEIVDIVGTGGDKLKTFNISTAASLVLASLDVPVAKHGGRSVTSLSGSADVIQSLNLPMPKDISEINESLKSSNYVYLCAPFFNDLLKNIAPLRRELGFPTLFNILGPIANPLRPKRQVIGVFHKNLIDKVTDVLISQNSKHALIVHSFEGMDELSISSQNYVTELNNGKIKKYILNAEDFGLEKSNITELIGGTPQENVEIINGIFDSKIFGAKRNVVVLNAAAGLYVSSKVSSIQEGIELAKSAIDSKKVVYLMNKLREKSY